MNANNPRVEIKIGGIRLSEHGLFPTRVDYNRNIDKTASRGRRKAKMNHARVNLPNADGRANNLLRAGSVITISAGYVNTPLLRWGTFQIEEAIRKKEENGGRHWNLTALSREMRLAEDKEAAQHIGLTHSDVAMRYAKKHDMKTRITPTNMKVSITKASQEMASEYLENLAFDCGFTFYIDDTEDVPVLVFGPDEDRPVIINGKRLTIGHGREGLAAGAMLIAKSLEFRHRFPKTAVGIKAKAESGKSASFFSEQLAKRQQLAGYTPDGGFTIPEKNVGPRSEYVPLSSGSEPVGSSLEEAKVKSAAGHAATKHYMSAIFRPGWPLVQIANTGDVVGEDDDNGTYKFVDLTQVWAESASETVIKGTLGASVSGKGASQTRGANFFNKRKGGGFYVPEKNP